MTVQDHADTPSAICLKRASTIAEIRREAGEGLWSWGDRDLQNPIALMAEQFVRLLDLVQFEPMCHHRP